MKTTVILGEHGRCSQNKRLSVSLIESLIHTVTEQPPT